MSLEIEQKNAISSLKEAAKRAAQQLEGWAGLFPWLVRESENHPELVPAVTEVQTALACVHERMDGIEGDEDVEAVQWLVDLSRAMELLAHADFVAQSSLTAFHEQKYSPVKPEAEILFHQHRWLCLQLLMVISPQIQSAVCVVKSVMGILTGATRLSEIKIPSETQPSPNSVPLSIALPTGDQTAEEVIALAKSALEQADLLMQQSRVKAQQEKAAQQEKPAKQSQPTVTYIRSALNYLRLAKVPGSFEQKLHSLIKATEKLADAIPLLDTLLNDLESSEAIGWLISLHIIALQALETRCTAEDFLNSLAS